VKVIDIIVPVYRGLAETRRCVESVLGSANRQSYELIVINDCSPEPEITQWLRDRASEGAFTLLENEHNLGFVATVNRGMQLHGDRDVLLLNSDTEVANNWLDRIVAAAASDDRIGTLTPFSNNATICSYPGFCQSNDLPQGATVASLDAVFSEANRGLTADIPTAVGFCMYIARACLDEVGYFDAETFGRGYGEENDFCLRASKCGWRNLLVADVFVFHEGSVSFSTECTALQQEAMVRLVQKHPDYPRLIRDWIQADPLQMLRRNIDMARLNQGNRPAVLFVAHNSAGGTYKHMRDLAVVLGERLNIFLLEPVGSAVQLSWLNTGECLTATFDLAEEWSRLLDILQRLGIQRVHYHHVMGYRPDTLNLHKALGIPCDITLHDYYLLCPQVHLSDASSRYCGFPQRVACDSCLQERPVDGQLSIAEWRAQYRALMNSADRVFCPAQDVMDRFRTVFDKARYVYAPHPVVGDAELDRVREIDVKDRPIRVACLGALPEIKGVAVLEAAAVDARKQNHRVEYHLIGYGSYKLKERPEANLVVHGQYDNARLHELIDTIAPDIFWFPAQVPETYGYTLSEVLAAGYPVAVTDLGALAERVAGRPNSWACPLNTSPAAWNAFFLSLAGELVPAQNYVPDTRSDFDYSEHYWPAESNESSAVSVTAEDFLPVGIPVLENGHFAGSRLSRAIHYFVTTKVGRMLSARIDTAHKDKVKSMLRL